MLILSRGIGESLIVDDDVIVTVLDVKDKQVRLGVHAPEEKAIHCEEVYQTIKAKPTGRFRPPRQRGIHARIHR